MDARRGALARRVEAGELAAPVEIGEDAADRVVRGRRDRDRRLRRVVALLDEAPHQRREAAAVDRAQVEQHRAARRDLARDDVARRELVGEAVALLVEEEAPSPRSASESRSDESTSVVGWNWTNSRSASAAPARYAAAIPSPTAPAGFVVRSQSAAAPPVESSVARAATARRSVTTPTQRSSSRQTREHPLALGDRDPRMREHALGELSRDAVAGRRAARVDDAAAAVAALEPEPVVELDAELDEIADARGRLVRQHRHGARPAETAAGAKRVLGVERRVVVLAHAAAMPPCASRLVDERSGPFVRTRTSPSAAAQSAAKSPATPPPTTTSASSRVVACISGFAHGSFRL